MHFFPSLYPDELLYSVFARYHSYSGNVSSKKTMRDLFGSMTVCAVTDLPCHLNRVSQQIFDGAISKETLLYNHTLYPYYGVFLSNDRADKVISEMMFKDGHSVHMLLGITACGVKNPQRIKFCSACIEEDRTLYGVCYWHRSHQLPGVRACHKHHISLTDSNVPFASRRNKHEFVSLETVNTYEKPSLGMTEKSDYDLLIAQVSYKLLNMMFVSPMNLGQLKNAYMYRLKALNMLTNMGKVKLADLISKFTDN